MRKLNFFKNYFRRMAIRISERMNHYKINEKLRFTYIFCVLLPLIITDSVIIFTVAKTDHITRTHELENITEAVKYNLITQIDSAVTISFNIYTNTYINEFMNKKYESPLDYYDSYLKQMQDSLFKSSIGTSSSTITMYADNDTIINGGEFARLETISDTKWYQHLKKSEKDQMLFVYFDDSNVPVVDAKRRIVLIRKLDYYKRDKCEKILKIELDYRVMARNMLNMNYEKPVYVCSGEQIIFSNDGYMEAGNNFEQFQEWSKIGYQDELNLYDQEFDIYVLHREKSGLQHIRDNLPLILFLICVNALLPLLFMRIINKSFTKRLSILSNTFAHVGEDSLKEIKKVQGTDEIGALMQSYNKMALRMNELIQTVYVETLKQQELDIARKNAELLALRGQINPHFLFNALESIRMHSILKNEMETADMVERLAKMERQYVDWGSDFEIIKAELEFVEAYLKLQKYRFGDRLNYRIEADEGCMEYKLPKLTLLTFVENACVHGFENKSGTGWIFVRVCSLEDCMYLEVEDTGNGIGEPKLSELREKMRHSDIQDLKSKGRVGMINACLRLKMLTDNRVTFDLESEEGAGTIVTVTVPKI